MQMELPELLNAEQVAEILQRHPRTVLNLVREGQLAAIKIGPRGVRFTREDVAAYIQRRRVGVE